MERNYRWKRNIYQFSLFTSKNAIANRPEKNAGKCKNFKVIAWLHETKIYLYHNN